MAMRLFRQFARDRRGAIAVEMAFVGPPFLLLMLALLDFGQTLLTQSVLDGAARDAARLVRTGQVQLSGSPIATFQNQLCSELSALMSTTTCQNNVMFEVQVFAGYGTMTFTSCTKNANSTVTGGTACSFTPGSGGNIVGVQVSYARPYIIPWVGACLTGGSCWTGRGSSSGGAGTQSTLLVSTVIFQNEPFPS
jgi:Flp pilus assembly protein TadG